VSYAMTRVIGCEEEILHVEKENEKEKGQL
jgi:hypothetical protein